MLRITTLTSFLFLSVTIWAQQFDPQKVTIEELSQKKHPTDTSAVAAMLYKIGSVRFDYTQHDGFNIVLDVEARVKIYKKEGYEWANHSIPYYISGNEQEKVRIIEAVTYNLVDGKITKTKMKSDGEFDEKKNRFMGVKKITLPNVAPGSIIEYHYTISSPFLSELPDWTFQDAIPVDFSQFQVSIPEYFIYSVNQQGYETVETKSEKGSSSITITNKERSGGYVTQTTFSNDKIDYQLNKTTYTTRNLPAMFDESFVNNIRNYITMVTHELSSVHMPNSPFKNLSTDWPSVVKTIYDNDNFGAELSKTGYFENDVDALLKGLTTPAEKISAIFSHVKSSVKWNDYYGYYCNDGVRKAYKDKAGNVAEINLMLTSMLRYAGFDANPVLISTRSNGISFFPNRNAFNYVIAGVDVNGQRILLDATEPFSVPNVLPTRDLNWMGRLIRKDGTSEEIGLMPSKLAAENVSVTCLIKANGDLEGKMRRQFADHKALSYRRFAVGKAEEQLLESLEHENDQIQISDYKRENDREISLPIVETFAFSKTGAADVIEDKLYIDPLLFLAYESNPFKQEKRLYPVDFGFPSLSKYTVVLQLPEGYAVESLPSPMNLSTGDDIGSCKFNSAANGNTVQITFTETLGQPIVSAEYYPILKEFFQKVVEKQHEKIVLKKL